MRYRLPSAAPLVVTFALGLVAVPATAQEAAHFRSLDNETMLTGYLSRPAGDARRPAVVMLHGCSGLLNRERRMLPVYQAWSRTLAAKGYVALAVDSASPRGFAQTCTEGPQRRVMRRDRPKDAYAALRHLQAQPFVDPDRVALMGWSQGGGTVLLAISDRSLARPAEGGKDFAAAIAFYPAACNDVFQSRPFTPVAPGSWTTKTPLLVLFGEADNWTPFAPCAAFIAAAKGRGNPVEMKSYPDALHSFDAPNLPRTELPAYRLANGVAPLVGTDDEARADALLRALAFLEGRLGR